MAYDYIGAIVTGLMLIGFMLSVLFNFASLKLYHIIPMPLFLFTPYVAVLILVTIQFMVKMGIDIYTKANEMVSIKDKWNRIVARSSDKKYVTRRIRATRVIRFHGGFLGFKVYECTKFTKVADYEAILSYTISAVLSVDTSQLKRVEI
jgi:hypothetical protein